MTPANLTPAPARAIPTVPVAGQQQAWAQACRTLWVATLSLMSAFMQNRAPAHRYLLARRIAGNFALLEQQDCFAQKTRESFARLSSRWQGIADKCRAPEPEASAGWLRRVKLALFS